VSEPSIPAPATASVPDSTGLRLLAVHAHPDDESSKGAATMAAYAAAGAEVLVVTCTGGEAGSVLNPSYAHPVRAERDIAGVRHAEMAAAARALGVRHRWLGFLDSGLPEGDPLPALPDHCFAEVPLETAAAPLVAVVRRFRPHVILSYDEAGGYPHPDHIRAHEVTRVAWERAGDADAYPGTGPAWEPLKLYYDRAFHPAKYQALHEGFLAAGEESPFSDRLEMHARMEAMREVLRRRAEGEEVPDPEHLPPFVPPVHEVTTQIPVQDFLDERDAALRAHATQVDPEGMFFAAPNELQRSTWPWEDYALIESRVRAAPPETDLFAGVR